MKIEIRPIEINRWHKKKGKESFTRNKKIQALIDPETRNYATGLSEEDIKFLKEEKGITYDLSNTFTDGQAHPFWDSPTAVVTLENKTMFLDSDKGLDYIKIKLLKASKYIANSMKEYEHGDFPEATHVIFDEKEEIEVKATKVAIKKKAVLKSSELSKSKKIQLVMILSNKNLKNQSDDYIEVEIDNLIGTKANDVLRIIEQDPEDNFLHALVLESLQKNVLRKVGHKILYLDSVIGTDVFDVVEYLKRDENQDFKLKIMSAVND